MFEIRAKNYHYEIYDVTEGEVSYFPIEGCAVYLKNGNLTLENINVEGRLSTRSFPIADVAIPVSSDGEDLVRKVIGSRLSAIRTIEYAHEAVHYDNFVTANYYNPVADLADGSTLDFLISCPSTLELHSIVKVLAGGACDVSFYEDVTTSSDGTSIIHARNNRYSVKSNITTYVNPVVTDVGTKFFEMRLFGTTSGSSNQQLGGSTRAGEEWVLKPNTKYLVRIVSDAANNEVGLLHEYYEVPAGVNDRN